MACVYSSVRFLGCMSIPVFLLAAAGCGDRPLSETVRTIDLLQAVGLVKPKPPVPQRPAGVSLLPGEQVTVPLHIDRRGNMGPMKFAVTAVPDGVTVAIEPISGEASATTFTVAASPSLGETALEGAAHMKVTVNGQSAEIQIPVHVPRLPRPTMRVVEPVVMQPGTSREMALDFDLDGYDGGMPLDFQETPGPVAVTVSGLDEGSTRALLSVQVAKNAPDGSVSCRLGWMCHGRAGSAEVPLIIERHPFSFLDRFAVVLEPNEATTKTIGLQRGVYRGPVKFEVEGLPPGVTASFSRPETAGNTVDVVFVADTSAAEGVQFVTLRAVADSLREETRIPVRVLGKTAPLELPLDLVRSLKDIARPRAGGVAARFSLPAKASLTQFYGSPEGAAEAIITGLRWLASMQQEDGHWPADEDAQGGQVPDLAVAAAALLPFLAEGVSHAEESVHADNLMPFPKVVKKALVLIATSQSMDNGDTNGLVGANLPAHVLGLTALSEAYAMSGNERLLKHAKSAVDYLEREQMKKGAWAGPQGGSWAGPNGPTSWATASTLLALRTARACGVGVKTEVLRKAEKFLQTCHAGPPTTPGAVFSARPDGPPDPDATAACLLAALYASSSADSADLLAGCDFLMTHLPEDSQQVTERPIDFFLLGGQVLRNVEGERFDRWNAAVTSFLMANQIQEGPLEGSWNPEAFGDGTDRVRTTAFAILCLQANYRYLPLFRLARLPSEAVEGPPE